MIPASRLRTALAILAGGVLLVWPALLNGYPILFSDTGAFLHQTLGPLMIWDKPWIYGPLLHLLHWRQTLWLPVLAQGLLVSHLVWLTARAWQPDGGAAPRPGLHLLLCTLLAAGTTLPFSAALLMPDVLTPAMVVALALLGFAAERLRRGERLWLAAIATISIAAHLSNLPTAAALAALTALMARDWRPVARVAAPLGLAIALLLVTNGIGHGRFGLSPHGSTFLLARLVADGPAARTIAAACPARGWYLCAFAGRLPTDSDVFLWEPDSPVNRDAAGRPRILGGALLSPEAREIVAETLRREPWAVLRDALANTVRQAGMAGIGDTLGPEHLGVALGPRLAEGFPPAEGARFAAALQVRGRLAAQVMPWLPAVHAVVLVAGAAGALWAWWRAATALAAARRRADAAAEATARRRLGLVVAVLVAVLANAAATGALSGPHPRYQARIAWLMPLVTLLALAPSQRRAAA